MKRKKESIEKAGKNDQDDQENEMEDMVFQDSLPGPGTCDLNGGHVESLVSESFFTTECDGSGTPQDQSPSVLQGFIHPPDSSNIRFSMPYTCFKEVWAKVALAARAEHTEWGFTFSPDGQTINIPDKTGAFQEVKFSQLGLFSRLLIDSFTTAVQVVLPGSLYKEFSKHNLTDDLGCRESIFQQPANQSQLQHIIMAAYDRLLGKSLEDNMMTYLEVQGPEIFRGYSEANRSYLLYKEGSEKWKQSTVVWLFIIF
ncbi:hypothetical protein EV702DRAFT_1042589 [Suillus placidus]|uniref:Uncharacterized protein n=1 Tax=Suillus placidus TaxID=48579 RepID=A0A9P7A339_9AGAM|nr:hypothetical protein EV702DRAFT_1042589 [Suillus placidus]